jgi:outer membrane protein assembly factor BamB
LAVRESPNRRHVALGVAAIAVLALAATACSGPPKPRGWAAAQPVTVANNDLVLVPFKGKVFAMEDQSSATAWQFPPRDKTAYGISEDAARLLKEQIDTTSIESTAKKELEEQVDDLRIDGPTKDALKDAVDATAMTDDEKDALNDRIDSFVDFEDDALRSLRAIYGDLALSSDSETVYVATFRGMVFALSTETGATRWIQYLGDEAVGGVALEGDRLFVGTKDSRLFALDAANGDEVWSYETNGEVWSTPVLDDGTLYGTSLDGTVYALNSETGAQIWEFTGAGSGIAGQATLVDGSLYVGAFDNKLYALNADDGSMKWTADADNWFWATPAVEDGIVYAASLDGKVYAVRAEDGSAAWPKPYDTGSPVRSAPVIVGGGLVVASRDAQLHRLNLTTGEPLEGSPVPVGEESTVEADLALGEGSRVYVVPRGANLYTFEADEGLAFLSSFPLPN